MRNAKIRTCNSESSLYKKGIMKYAISVVLIRSEWCTITSEKKKAIEARALSLYIKNTENICVQTSD